MYVPTQGFYRYKFCRKINPYKFEKFVSFLFSQLMNYPSNTDNSELTAVQQQLALVNQEKRKLLDQVRG